MIFSITGNGEERKGLYLYTPKMVQDHFNIYKYINLYNVILK